MKGGCTEKVHKWYLGAPALQSIVRWESTQPSGGSEHNVREPMLYLCRVLAATLRLNSFTQDGDDEDGHTGIGNESNS